MSARLRPVARAAAAASGTGSWASLGGPMPAAASSLLSGALAGNMQPLVVRMLAVNALSLFQHFIGASSAPSPSPGPNSAAARHQAHPQHHLPTPVPVSTVATDFPVASLLSSLYSALAHHPQHWPQPFAALFGGAHQTLPPPWPSHHPGHHQLSVASASPALFADISNGDALEVRAPDPAAAEKPPPPGLTIEGACANARCASAGAPVLCHLGYGNFNFKFATTAPRQQPRWRRGVLKNFKFGAAATTLGGVSLACPRCSAHSVAPATCGFRGCEWAFEGRKHGAADALVSPFYSAGDAYTRVRGSKNAAHWDRLVITARPPCRAETRECAVCMGAVGEGAAAAAVGVEGACGHHFHAKCLLELKWRTVAAGKAAVCPTCSAAL